jgi:hypothetical protein
LNASSITLSPMTRRSVLIVAGLLGAGAAMVGINAMWDFRKAFRYSLSGSYIGRNFMAMVGWGARGSELHIWNSAGKLRAIVRSENALSYPFVSESGRTIFIDRKMNGDVLFRLREINLSDQKPAVSTLYETDSFLGSPSLVGEDIVLITGKYFVHASGNPVPGRKIAILRGGVFTVLAGAKFSTIGRLCSLGGGRYLGVSIRVELDNAVPAITRFVDTIYDLQVEGNRLNVSPFNLVPAPAGTILALACWDGKLAVKSYMFPASGGQTVFITIAGLKDGSVLQRIDLAPEADTSVPYWLARTDSEADIAALTLEKDGKPAMLVITLKTEAMTKINLTSDRTPDFFVMDI